jgi:hypothetical protein
MVVMRGPRIHVFVRRVGNLDADGTCPLGSAPGPTPGLCQAMPGGRPGQKAQGTDAGHDDKGRSMAKSRSRRVFLGSPTVPHESGRQV